MPLRSRGSESMRRRTARASGSERRARPQSCLTRPGGYPEASHMESSSRTACNRAPGWRSTSRH
eukprot:10137532-Alexandrium_andersonii.AAC.1